MTKLFELILEIILSLGGISFRISCNLYLRRGPVSLPSGSVFTEGTPPILFTGLFFSNSFCTSEKAITTSAKDCKFKFGDALLRVIIIGKQCWQHQKGGTIYEGLWTWIKNRRSFFFMQRTIFAFHIMFLICNFPQFTKTN